MVVVIVGSNQPHYEFPNVKKNVFIAFLFFFLFFYFLTLQYCIGFAIYQHESVLMRCSFSED